MLKNLKNMKNIDIKNLLLKKLSLKEIHVSNEGKNFQIIAIGTCFEHMTSLKRQQMIYAPLMKYVLNQTIHAICIKAYTLTEWKNINTF